MLNQAFEICRVGCTVADCNKYSACVRRWTVQCCLNEYKTSLEILLNQQPSVFPNTISLICGTKDPHKKDPVNIILYFIVAFSGCRWVRVDCCWINRRHPDLSDRLI